jgi:hypothetical protein
MLIEKSNEIISGAWKLKIHNSKFECGIEFETLFNKMADLNGFKIFGYDDENNGQLFHHVRPKKEALNTYSSQGSREFPFHTEAPHRNDSPDFLAILCVNKGSGAATRIVSVPEIESHLTQPMLDDLEREKYTIKIGYTWEQSGQYTKIRIRKKPGHWAYHEANLMMPLIHKRSINDAINKCRIISEVLSPGEILVMSNGGVLHGREKFVPTLDENDRHLIRVYLTKRV